jgi:fatty acid/phospholipid biosynthesis enzyme
MQLTIEGKDLVICGQLKSKIIRKAQLIATRTGKNIRKIKISFTEIKGPKGGKDKQCKVQVLLFGLPSVLVITHRANIHQALAKALHQASKVLKHGLHRQGGASIQELAV